MTGGSAFSRGRELWENEKKSESAASSSKQEPMPNAYGPRSWQMDRPGCEPWLLAVAPLSNHLSHYAVARVRAPRSDPFANQDFGVADLWEATVKKFANRPSIIFEGQTFTFKQIDERTSSRTPAPFTRAHMPTRLTGPACSHAHSPPRDQPPRMLAIRIQTPLPVSLTSRSPRLLILETGQPSAVQGRQAD